MVVTTRRIERRMQQPYNTTLKIEGSRLRSGSGAHLQPVSFPPDFLLPPLFYSLARGFLTKIFGIEAFRVLPSCPLRRHITWDTDFGRIGTNPEC
jgi:hypothetical protein